MKTESLFKVNKGVGKHSDAKPYEVHENLILDDVFIV